MDLDKDGYIGMDDLTLVLTGMGRVPTKEEVQEMIEIVSLGSRIKVNFEDFRAMMRYEPPA